MELKRKKFHCTWIIFFFCKLLVMMNGYTKDALKSALRDVEDDTILGGFGK
jgi:hypothetical protein